MTGQILSLYAYSKREQADLHLEKGGFVNASLDSDGEFRVYNWDRIPVSYPGTGDIFAAVLTGSILPELEIDITRLLPLSTVIMAL